MKAAGIALIVATSWTAATAAPKPTDAPASAASRIRGREPLRLTVDSRRRIFDIPVAFSYATTIWFEVDCYEVVLGDPDWFAIAYNTKRKSNRRYVLTPYEDKPGAATNVSFECDQGVEVVVRVQQGPPEDAVLGVRFELDPKESDRVRRAVAKEREKAAKDLKSELKSHATQVEEQVQRELMLAMLTRFRMDDDREIGRDDFFVVRTHRQAVIGEHGYIVLKLHNLTGDDVTVDSIEAFDERADSALESTSWVMENPRVASGAEVLAAVRFQSPDTLDTVRLVVREKGTRVIEITDVDM